MNILDVKIEDLGLTGEDRLDQMFQRQLLLMQKYHSIEDKIIPGSTSEVPVNLHDAKGQYRLKDFAWRITEELGEALEAVRTHPQLKEHYDEEIADSLHFLIEFTILSGMTPDDIINLNVSCSEISPTEPRDRLDHLYHLFGTSRMRRYQTLVTSVGFLVESLAITCNCLKNKPWKQTHMLTDTVYFRARVCRVWRNFISLCSLSGIYPEDLTNLYLRKSEVNKFRQRSNY